MKPLRIYTPVFGKKHISWLKNALGRSLSWPKNKAAIEKARWSLFIHDSEFDEVMEIVTKILPEDRIETIECNEPFADMVRKRGPLMCQAFAKALAQCLADGSQMLISTPDFIWADGSIPNMRQLARQKNTCVSVPHLRVQPSTLSEIDGPYDSPSLFDFSRRHWHGAWTTSELGKHIGTYKGGILWREIRPGVVTLQHRMPSPYLINVTAEDLPFFGVTDGVEQSWGAIDHTWAQHLCASQRWRMVLSSDIAFMIEVTEPYDNVPPAQPIAGRIPDDFWTQERSHHLLNQIQNRQYVATFRGNG